MDNVMEFMSKDHDRLDGLFQEFRNLKDRDFSKAENLFTEFKSGLERHIAWEEEILFPIFETKTGMYDSGPTAVMRSEHRQIKEYLGQIRQKIVNQDTKTEELENGLVEVLTAHNLKEENILYPWIDNSVTEKEREEAFVRMRSLLV